MKKWCIIDDSISKRSLETLEVYESKEEALEEAEAQWDHMSEHDKKDRDSFTVGLCNVEQCEDGSWQQVEDENGNVDADIYEIAKEFC